MAEEKTNQKRGPAVARPKTAEASLVYTSVSAIQKFSHCERAWYLRYVEGLPDKPSSKSQVLGTEIHSRLEKYLKTGQNVLGPLELPAKALLPSPGEGLLLEHSIEGKIADVPLVGFIDCLNLRRLPDLLKLTDYKTTKSIDKWAASSRDIVDPSHEKGIQMIVYSAYALQKYPAKHVVPEHIYIQTAGRRDAKPVAAEPLAAKEIFERVKVVELKVQGMKATAKVDDCFKVPANMSFCDAYGGCAYKTKCFDPMAGLLASIKGGASKENGVGFFDKTRSTVVSGSTAVSGSAVTKTEPTVVISPSLSILPPDEPVFPMGELRNPALEAMTGNTVIMPAAPTFTAAPPVPVAALPVRKRGRPRKGVGLEQVAEVAVKPAPPVSVEYMAIANTMIQGERRLYLGCFPRGVSNASLLPFVELCEKHVIDAQKKLDPTISIVDIRTASDSKLGFGKWEAYVAVATKGLIANLPAGHYVVSRGDKRVECVADALANVLPAGCVIQGAW